MAAENSGLRGSIGANRAEYRLGEPIWVALELANGGDRDAYVFLPRGRADGVRVSVRNAEAGRDYDVAGLGNQAEAGLVGELSIEPGGSVTQEYLLTEWIKFKVPGTYIVRCEVEIEAYATSLRQPDSERHAEVVPVSAEIRLTIGPPV